MIYRMGFMSVVLLCAQLSAEDQAVRGAQQVLAELRDKSSKPKVQAKPTTPSQQLAADIKAFGEQSQDLAPNQATAKWLALFDRVLTAKNTEPDVDGELDMSALIQAQMMRQSFSFDMDMPMGMNQNSARAIIELMQVIPQPTTWDAISKGMIEQVKKQSSLSPGAADSLRVLAYMIGNDQPAATKYITALETHAEKLDSASPLLLQLASHFHDEKEEGSHLALDFEIKLEQFESRGNANPGYGNDLAVPDLVTLIGKEKAEALLRRALVLPHVEVTIQVGDQTKLLARQLAMEMIDKITRPPWKLCNSLDPIELYEALDKKFTRTKPKKKTKIRAKSSGLISALVDRLASKTSNSETSRSRDMYQWEKQHATAYYLTALIIAGRQEDAFAKIKSMKIKDENNMYIYHSITQDLKRIGQIKAVHDFLQILLTRQPKLPFWDSYIQLAARVNQSQQALDLLRTSLKRDDLSSKTRRRLTSKIITALLSADHVDEAVVLLQQQISKLPGSKHNLMGTPGIKLATLGQLLDKPAWVEQGLTYSLKRARFATDADGISELVALLIKVDRAAEAQTLIVKQLKRAINASDLQDNYGMQYGNQPTRLLTMLLSLYHQLDRHTDVITLLDEAPWWGATDIKTLLTNSAATAT